ncbi:hypothetical protein [Calothrix sp. PCC 6303]|uniref:hypothetical protein n=1 Tax=Calothrix sp. PCC 6303 TaxID=1170562 RepID=UPI0002A043AC|nr:hypothetical protein [Calothrix sp. PCC 6303]AFZ03727.1 hypothetical protein Cal6303_4829 [Calothrix sp. PCC 6303]
MNSHQKSFVLTCLSLIFATAPSNYASATNIPAEQNNPIILAQSSTLKNTTVLPGKRVGAITKKTKKADLIKIFGSSKLQDGKTAFFGGDAEFYSTTVKLGKAEYSLDVLWKDQKRTQVAGVIVYDPQWKTAEGIGVGTALNTLRQKAGEFKFSGFGWDYGGIMQLQNTKLSKYQSITIQMDIASNAYDKYPNDAQYASGDQELLSQDPKLKNLNISISRMIVMFD